MVYIVHVYCVRCSVNHCFAPAFLSVSLSHTLSTVRESARASVKESFDTTQLSFILPPSNEHIDAALPLEYIYPANYPHSRQTSTFLKERRGIAECVHQSVELLGAADQEQERGAGMEISGSEKKTEESTNKRGSGEK